MDKNYKKLFFITALSCSLTKCDWMDNLAYACFGHTSIYKNKFATKIENLHDIVYQGSNNTKPVACFKDQQDFETLAKQVNTLNTRIHKLAYDEQRTCGVDETTNDKLSELADYIAAQERAGFRLKSLRNSNDENKNTTDLWLVCTNNNKNIPTQAMVDYILSFQNLPINTFDQNSGMTAFHMACQQSYSQLVIPLLDLYPQQIDITLCTQPQCMFGANNTALHMACISIIDINTMQSLVTAKPNTDVLKQYRPHAPQIVNRILQMPGLSIEVLDQKNVYGHTALHETLYTAWHNRHKFDDISKKSAQYSALESVTLPIVQSLVNKYEELLKDNQMKANFTITKQTWKLFYNDIINSGSQADKIAAQEIEKILQRL